MVTKFIVRVDCTVEFVVEANNIEDVQNYVCDLNNDELDKLPKTVTEIYDVIEVEEL